MKDGLYNRRAYGLPAGAAERFSCLRAELAYAQHAFREARDDQHGVADLPGSIDILAEDVVEVEVAEGAPSKAVVRFPYDDRFDLVLVLMPCIGNQYFVKTVWFNRVSDNHKTLRLAPYSKP